MRRSTLIAVALWAALPTPGWTKPAAKKPALPVRSAPPIPTGNAPAPASGETGRDEALPPSSGGGGADAGAAAKAALPPPEKPRPASDSSSAPAEPKAAPAPAAPAVVMPSGADLDKLRADYDRLREELFRARARAQIVAEATYPSRLSATLRWKGGAAQLIRRAQIRLDGGEVWDSGDKPVSDALVSVAERAIKPGPHALTLRLEVRPGKGSKDNERLGYTSEHTFAILIADKTRTRVVITADEDGDPPEYEPNVEVELETEK